MAFLKVEEDYIVLMNIVGCSTEALLQTRIKLCMLWVEAKQRLLRVTT